MNKVVMPKTMLLSWGVPPWTTGSAIIVGNLAKQFSRDEMVVVGARYTSSPPVAWLAGWPEIVYGMLQPPNNTRGERWLRLLQLPLLFLISWWTLVTRHCEALLVVYPDALFLLVGYLLSRLMRRPLFAYFHNTYLDNLPSSYLAAWLQPRVFATAEHIFVMSAGMQQYFRERYPDVITTPLVHSFNEPLPAEVDVPELHHPIRLVFAGNVNESCAEAASRVMQLAKGRSDIVLNVFSGTSILRLRDLGFTGPNIFIEMVSRDVLLERIRLTDVVVHPHGFFGELVSAEYQTIFPTKTIEYLISQRPILAHLPSDCFLADFYRQHECALIVDTPTVDALNAGLQRLCDDAALRQRLVVNALKAARQFMAPVVAGHLREIINGHA